MKYHFRDFWKMMFSREAWSKKAFLERLGSMRQIWWILLILIILYIILSIVTYVQEPFSAHRNIVAPQEAGRLFIFRQIPAREIPDWGDLTPMEQAILDREVRLFDLTTDTFAQRYDQCADGENIAGRFAPVKGGGWVAMRAELDDGLSITTYRFSSDDHLTRVVLEGTGKTGLLQNPRTGSWRVAPAFVESFRRMLQVVAPNMSQESCQAMVDSFGLEFLRLSIDRYQKQTIQKGWVNYTWVPSRNSIRIICQAVY